MDDAVHLLTNNGFDGQQRPPELISMFSMGPMTIRVVATWPPGLPHGASCFTIEARVKASLGEVGWQEVPGDKTLMVAVAAAHEVRRLRTRNRDLELAFMEHFGSADQISNPGASAERIAGAVRDNYALLQRCAGPHRFSPAAIQGESIIQWVCELCGGVLSNPQRELYDSGLRHRR